MPYSINTLVDNLPIDENILYWIKKNQKLSKNDFRCICTLEDIPLKGFSLRTKKIKPSRLNEYCGDLIYYTSYPEILLMEFYDSNQELRYGKKYCGR